MSHAHRFWNQLRFSCTCYHNRLLALMVSLPPYGISLNYTQGKLLSLVWLWSKQQLKFPFCLSQKLLQHNHDLQRVMACVQNAQKSHQLWHYSCFYSQLRYFKCLLHMSLIILEINMILLIRECKNIHSSKDSLNRNFHVHGTYLCCLNKFYYYFHCMHFKLTWYY